MTKATTLGELKQTEWASPARLRRTVKDELRDNLVCLLENGSPLFPGIVGYEDTVIPQLVTAVLSRHNFILLGLGGHLLSDELTMHFGLLPRANRGVFAINELPDLAGKIQVGLFNVMQEGDVQIKGYPVRLNLDVALVFTANPEDYTARGKIITPLKDRIGSEIVTHYPHTVELGATITQQEAWVERDGRPIRVPDFMAELIERVAFEARVGGANVDDIVHWFDEGGALKVSGDERAETLLKGFSVVPGLLDLVIHVGLAGKKDPGTLVSACELVLEGLVAEKRLSRSEELGYARARAEAKRPPYGQTGGGPGGPVGPGGPGGPGGPNLFS